jgi:hypothetical protein
MKSWVRNAWLVPWASLMAVACGGSPEGLAEMPRELGFQQALPHDSTRLAVLAPEAARLTGFEVLDEIRGSDGSTTFILDLPAGWWSNGQFGRLVLVPDGNGGTLVHSFCQIKVAGNVTENPIAAQRNLVLNLLLLTMNEEPGAP